MLEVALVIAIGVAAGVAIGWAANPRPASRQTGVMKRRFAERRAGFAYPVALTLAGWFCVGLTILGRAHDDGEPTMVGGAVFLLVVVLLLAFRDRAKGPLDDRGKQCATGFPACAWLGVGVLPAFYVAFLMFDQSPETGWLPGAFAVVSLAIGTAFSLRLTTDPRRRQQLSRSGGFFVLSPFIGAISNRFPAPADGLQAERQRHRRRDALAAESLLSLIALVLAGFTGLLTFLAIEDYGVQLSGEGSSVAAIKQATSTYIAWQALDLVPLLNVPDTLNWTLHRTYTDSYSGAIVLALKVFILFPVIGTVALLVRGTHDPREEPRQSDVD